MIQYDVDEIGISNFPRRLRKHFTIELLKTLLSPIKLLFNEFYLFFSKKKYDLTFDGRVVYLEHVLNDIFDPLNREIFIEDAPQQQTHYIFNEIEGNEAVYMYNEIEQQDEFYLYNQEEIDNSPSFIVWVPSTIIFNESQMKALVNKYKISGKNYVILNY